MIISTLITKKVVKKSSHIGFDGLASVIVAIVKSDKEASFYFVPITPILLLLSLKVIRMFYCLNKE